MQTDRVHARRDLDRLLRALCRCDGMKDVAVVAALIFVAGALVVRLAVALQAVTSFS